MRAFLPSCSKPPARGFLKQLLTPVPWYEPSLAKPTCLLSPSLLGSGLVHRSSRPPDTLTIGTPYTVHPDAPSPGEAGGLQATAESPRGSRPASCPGAASRPALASGIFPPRNAIFHLMSQHASVGKLKRGSFNAVLLLCIPGADRLFHEEKPA